MVPCRAQLRLAVVPVAVRADVVGEAGGQVLKSVANGVKADGAVVVQTEHLARPGRVLSVKVELQVRVSSRGGFDLAPKEVVAVKEVKKGCVLAFWPHVSAVPVEKRRWKSVEGGDSGLELGAGIVQRHPEFVNVEAALG